MTRRAAVVARRGAKATPLRISVTPGARLSLVTWRNATAGTTGAFESRAGAGANRKRSLPAVPYNLPIVMAFSTLLPVVGDLKADTVRITEEGRPIIWGILGAVLSLRRLDAQRTQCVGDSDNITN